MLKKTSFFFLIIESLLVFLIFYFHTRFSVKTTHIHSPIQNAFAFKEEKLINAITPTPTSFPRVTPNLKPSLNPTPTLTSYNPAFQELDTLFTKYSQEYSVEKNLLLKIADCESEFNTNAKNGDYEGLYQFSTTAWKTNRALMGKDTNPELRKKPEEAISTAAFMLSRGFITAWPNCK